MDYLRGVSVTSKQFYLLTMHVPSIPPVLVDNPNRTAAVALLHYMGTGYINNGSRMDPSGNEVSLAPPLPPVATPDDPNRVNVFSMAKVGRQGGGCPKDC